MNEDRRASRRSGTIAPSGVHPLRAVGAGETSPYYPSAMPRRSALGMVRSKTLSVFAGPMLQNWVTNWKPQKARTLNAGI